jgi:hypothetical protein
VVVVGLRPGGAAAKESAQAALREEVAEAFEVFVAELIDGDEQDEARALLGRRRRRGRGGAPAVGRRLWLCGAALGGGRRERKNQGERE